MALVTCRECKKEVSSEARSCPHCGIAHPDPRGGKAISTLAAVGQLLGAVATLLFLYCLWSALK